MIYDIERLKEDATGPIVAEFIGMEVQYKGAYVFTYCPGHLDALGKMDAEMTNCILTKNGYKCFACGQTKDVFAMVEAYYRNYLNIKLSFTEICEKIGDSLGGHELYYSKKTKFTNQKENFKLSNSDYKLLGLKASYTINNILNSGSTKEEGIKQQYIPIKDNKIDSYLYIKNEHISLQTLLYSAPDLYYKIILKYAMDAKNKYSLLLKKYGDRNAENVEELFLYINGENLNDEFLLNINRILYNSYKRSCEIYTSILNKINEQDDNNNSKYKDNKIKEIHQECIEKNEVDYYALFG